MSSVHSTLLDLSERNLTVLPALPQGLITLNCEKNNLVSLPDLPDTLEELYCEGNQLRELPKIPDSLEFLFCSRNNLTELPELPKNLLNLYCDHNASLEELPELPEGLTELNCGTTNISKLPNLPDTINILDCNYAELEELPKLPDDLRVLFCSANFIETIPKLPLKLTKLFCSSNMLERLPDLPPKLHTLKCRENEIVELPTLPDSLFILDCDFDKLNNSGFEKMLRELGSPSRNLLEIKTKCAVINEIRRRRWRGVLPVRFIAQNSGCDNLDDDDEDDDDFDYDEDDDDDNNGHPVHHTNIIENLPDIELKKKGRFLIKKDAVGVNIIEQTTDENVLEFLKEPDNVVLYFNGKYYLFDRSYFRIVPENLIYICNKAYEHGLDVTGRLKKDENGGHTIYFSMRKLGLYGIVPAHSIKQIIETKQQFFSMESKTPEERAPSMAGYEVAHNLIRDFTSRAHCQEGQDDIVYSIYSFNFAEEIEKKRKRSPSVSQTRKMGRSPSNSRERSASQTRKKVRSASNSGERSRSRSRSQSRQRSRGGTRKKKHPRKKMV